MVMKKQLHLKEPSLLSQNDTSSSNLINSFGSDKKRTSGGLKSPSTYIPKKLEASSDVLVETSLDNLTVDSSNTNLVPRGTKIIQKSHLSNWNGRSNMNNDSTDNMLGFYNPQNSDLPGLKSHISHNLSRPLENADQVYQMYGTSIVPVEKKDNASLSNKKKIVLGILFLIALAGGTVLEKY